MTTPANHSILIRMTHECGLRLLRLRSKGYFGASRQEAEWHMDKSSDRAVALVESRAILSFPVVIFHLKD